MGLHAVRNYSLGRFLGEMPSPSGKRDGRARTGTNRADINFQLKQTGSALIDFMLLKNYSNFAFISILLLWRDFILALTPARNCPLSVATDRKNHADPAGSRVSVYGQSRRSTLTASGSPGSILCMLSRKLSLRCIGRWSANRFRFLVGVNSRTLPSDSGRGIKFNEIIIYAKCNKTTYKCMTIMASWRVCVWRGILFPFWENFAVQPN